ncbi:Gfo/Idh/MocA family protein [Paenarthrobacter histidinolovorans]|uniref:Gfo/Idh/MocA family protein n=1 Tax=Paenarthrobacter histidinolovorans TaxID=43664 RepID=UPI001668F0FF|nr:Gfo/Idh/MocA family oxidoreductase [Paenarthrobacter histidinolovorans]GGJ22385.1 oxidoreductase [Paenarthrobacter histidinolovorans]
MTNVQQPLRWAVVGTGGVSEYFVSDLNTVEGSVPVAIVSRDAARGREFADRYSVASSYEFSDALSDESVDVIYIATPMATHYTMAAAALKAGKHVVVEKPIAMNADEARELFSIARKEDRFLTEAMWMMFNPIFHAVLAAVNAGGIGHLRSIRASFGLPFPKDDGSRRDAVFGGSALLDQGIYAVSLVRALMGDPERVHVSGDAQGGVDLTHWITLEFSDGRFAQIAGSMQEYTDPSASINGTGGWISVDQPFWAAAGFTVRSGDIASAFTQPVRTERPADGFGYSPMIRAIGDAINAGDRYCKEHSPDDTVAVIELLERMRAKILNQASRSRAAVGRD